ncbi:hypothetical protein NUW54_g8807 [Trametes sanguinea]|uniref:Uncharacterized protein n=1 Tax=Trametes sanguinea TaxID=158606 RepID=A0ACC1PB78_9APHY|nr:hypothetical protein NUW54_g8807 [Trametes sanguinea]
MLLVGAYKYGFGNWEAMAKDPRLGLEGKFFLEEGKKGEDAASKPIPNAIHLVRRGDYLLGILREHDEKIRAIESTLTSRRQHSSKTSLSPGPPPIASTSYASSIRKRAESEAVAPCAVRGTVDGALGHGGGVDGGHGTLIGAELIINDLGVRGQAVGRAGSVGDLQGGKAEVERNSDAE